MFYFLKEIRMVSYEARRIKMTYEKETKSFRYIIYICTSASHYFLLSYYCFVCLSIENKPCLIFISGVSCVDV